MMNDIEIAKKMITGFFNKNYELSEIDDSIFIPIIRSGIEEAADGKNELLKELLEHAINEFTEVWLKSVEEDEDEYDIEHEKKEARLEFLNFYNNT